MSEHNLNMVQFQLNVPSLMKLAKKKRMPPHVTDMGYLTHCRLAEIFGDYAPSPFALQKNLGRYIQVLAFSDKTKEELLNHAQSFSNPESFEAVKWDDFFLKSMPEIWENELLLSFETKICPIRKMPRGSKIEKPGSEVDAFIAHCHTLADPNQPVDRERVYKQWLSDKFEKSGGAILVSAKMKSFKRERLVRRTQGDDRKAIILERPNALFNGILKVEDSDKFNQLLKRGIGRHRKFGFGMLLLKPLRVQPC